MDGSTLQLDDSDLVRAVALARILWHRSAVYWLELPAAWPLCGVIASSLLSGFCNDEGGGQSARTNNLVFPVVVVARRDGNRPVAGVKVVHDRDVLGVTDAAGAVQLKLKGVEGEARTLGIICPDQYASPEAPLVVGLRGMAPGSPSPKFETECVPLTRSIVVGVRVENGPNLPIVRLNQVLGTTNAEGIAHVMIEAAPNEQVSLTLDTRQYPGLQPQNPTLTFVAQDRDELVLLEQKFNKPKRTVKPVARPPVPLPL